MTPMKLRILLLAFVLAAAVGLAPRSQAIEVYVLGPSSISVAQGGSIWIDIGIDNASQTPTNGIEITLSGLSGPGAVVTAGTSATGYFYPFCSASMCFGGLQTSPDPSFDPTDLSNNGAYISSRRDSCAYARRDLHHERRRLLCDHGPPDDLYQLLGTRAWHHSPAGPGADDAQRGRATRIGDSPGPHSISTEIMKA